MPQKKPSITMFFPTFNEEGNIDRLINSAEKVLQEVADEYEILFVLYEATTDNTEGEIKKHIQKNPRIRIIRQPVSDGGVGRAYCMGFENAKYENVFYSDSDNQFNLEDIKGLLPYIEDYDVVAAYKIKRKDPVGRLVTSWGYNSLLRLLFGIRERDVNTAFRFVKKRAFEKLILKSTLGTVTGEMIVKASKAGFRIKQVGVTHYPRFAGKPLYELREGMISPKLVFRIFLEILRIFKDVYITKEITRK